MAPRPREKLKILLKPKAAEQTCSVKKRFCNASELSSPSSLSLAFLTMIQKEAKAFIIFHVIPIRLDIEDPSTRYLINSSALLRRTELMLQMVIAGNGISSTALSIDPKETINGLSLNFLKVSVIKTMASPIPMRKETDQNILLEISYNNI